MDDDMTSPPSSTDVARVLQGALNAFPHEALSAKSLHRIQVWWREIGKPRLEDSLRAPAPSADAERVLLKKYGKHIPFDTESRQGCHKLRSAFTSSLPGEPNRMTCTCGLDALLRAPQQPPSGDIRACALALKRDLVPTASLTSIEHFLSRHMPAQPCVKDVEALAKTVAKRMREAVDTGDGQGRIRGTLYPKIMEKIVHEAFRSHVTDAATVRAECDKWWRGKLEEHTYAALQHTKRLTSGNVSHCKPNIERRLNAIRALKPKERSDG